MARCKKPNRRILVVDDNQNIHEDFCAVFESTRNRASETSTEETALFGASVEATTPMEFEADFASQGQQALDMVRAARDEDRPYALAFVDVRMPPGWDGIATIQKLWEVSPDLEIVICTAYSDYNWRQIVDTLGQTHQLLIIKKPYDNIEVLQIAAAMTEKWNLARQAEVRQEELSSMVSERTRVLEEINKELEQFAYVVSHDLKAPLRGIQMLAEWIVADYCDKLDAEGVDNLKLMISRVERMHSLIDGILQYSRIGRVKEELSSINLNHVITEITEADYESTGLGLTLVKKIVETYGGKIWIESQVGQGTTFWFTIPKRIEGVGAEEKMAQSVS